MAASLEDLEETSLAAQVKVEVGLRALAKLVHLQTDPWIGSCRAERARGSVSSGFCHVCRGFCRVSAEMGCDVLGRHP